VTVLLLALVGCASDVPDSSQPSASAAVDGGSTAAPRATPTPEPDVALLHALPAIGWLGTSSPADGAEDVPEDAGSLRCQQQAYESAGVDVSALPYAEREYVFSGGVATANLRVIHAPSVAGDIGASIPDVVNCQLGLLQRSGVLPGVQVQRAGIQDPITEPGGGSLDFGLDSAPSYYANSWTWFVDGDNFYLINFFTSGPSDANALLSHSKMARSVIEDVHH
jgi:hypothetical protein